jgi:hypothetical protein
MDILEKARQHFPLETTGQPFQTHELQRIKVVREMADEIERLREEIHEYDDMIRDAGWYLTDDGGNSYKSADEIISHFLLAKDKARAEQIAALKESSDG